MPQTGTQQPIDTKPVDDTQQPTNPTEPTEPTNPGTGSQNDAPVATPVPFAAAFDGVIIAASGGGLRFIDPKQFGPITHTTELYGGFAEGSIVLSGPVDLAPRDRLERWQGGVCKYRGYIPDPANAAGDPETTTIRAYGRMLDLGRIKIDAPLVLPLSTDVATFVAKIVELWVRPVFPESVLSLDLPPTQVMIGDVDISGKSVQEAMNDLCDLAGGALFWGMDVDSATGKDRLYLGRTNVYLAIAEVPSGQITSASGGPQTSDIVNRLAFTGGTLPDWQSNLLPNPSFERPVRASDTTTLEAGNLVFNPGFEVNTGNNGTAPGWQFFNGAVIKQNNVGPNEPPAYEGEYAAELSDGNDGIAQTVNGLTPLRTYQFSFYARPSDQAYAATGTASLQWQTGGATVQEDIIDIDIVRAAYQRYAGLYTCPAGATSVLIRFDSATNPGPTIDNVRLVDNDLPVQEGWAVSTRGNATVQMDWAVAGSAKRGMYSITATVAGATSDGANAVILYPVGSFPVVYGSFYYFYTWAKATNPHAGALRMQFVESDGSHAGDPIVFEFSGSGLANWAWGNVGAAAPMDAATVTVSVEMRSNGVWQFDALTLMTDRGLDTFGVNADHPTAAPGDDDTIYIEGDTLTTMFRAEDYANGDTEIEQSVSVWGPRTGTETVKSIVTPTSAMQFAQAYFARRAKSQQVGSIGYPAGEIPALIGGALRLLGPLGQKYSGGIEQTCVRLRYMQDASGKAEEVAEFGKPSVTLPALIREGAKAEILRTR